MHIHTLLSTVIAHTLLNTAHTVGSDCGYNPGWCCSHPHCLRNDLKCVKWDVKPCPTQPDQMLELVDARSEMNLEFWKRSTKKWRFQALVLIRALTVFYR